jgi:hypothetical protein
MRNRFLVLLSASTLLAAAITLAFPRASEAWTYDGETVECWGTCAQQNQHCVPVNVTPAPIICPPSGFCPIGGGACNPGIICHGWAHWDCQCYIEGGGYGPTCTRF